MKYSIISSVILALTFVGPALATASSYTISTDGKMKSGDVAISSLDGDNMGDMAMEMPRLKFSYRYMHMDMAGNQIGSTNVSPAFIATTVPNRSFGLPGQPPLGPKVKRKIQWL